MLLLERKAFEEESIREAVNNALIHRDYQVAQSIFLFQYQTSIKIKSPGGFVEGVNINNILDESKPRNKLIADVLFKCDLVEQFGSGVNLMFKNQLKLGKLPPNFQESDANQVTLKLDGNIQDVEFAKYVLKIADEKQKILTDQELLLLYHIKENKKVKSSTITKNLLDLGIIEKIGYGKWILSSKYYADMKQRGKYTRQKGLSKERNKELILQHLRDYSEGSTKQDLLSVFNNELSWWQIWTLLNQLRKEEKVYFDGKNDPQKVFGN